MRNRIIGLLVFLFAGTITLVGAKSLVNSMDSNITTEMGPRGVYEEVEDENIIREMMR